MAPPPRQKILMLGDSLTQLCFEGPEGWGRDLANRYQRRADVLNRGMSGYNSRWYLRYAKDYDLWNEPGKVVLVTIWFGANDAATLAQGVPLEEYKTNLETMVDKAKESYPEAKILLIAPPPVAFDQRNEYLKKQFGDKAKDMAVRTSEVTGKYAATCVKVSKAKDIPCLDIFTEMTTTSTKDDETVNISQYFWDGLHFSDTGHNFVSKALSKAIHAHFPSLEVRPCSITGQYNNSSSLCDDLENSGPYHDSIKSKRTWEEAFD
mmetsp:Transcript_22734/g.56307  ORF Transcript_22734/g.56307 Transcript_22734/m.56307 type:complete len:264 (-) Transcript_22734:2024-2815(-)